MGIDLGMVILLIQGAVIAGAGIGVIYFCFKRQKEKKEEKKNDYDKY